MITLTGLPLLVLCVAFAVAVPSATIVGWERVRGPRPVRVAVRVTLLAGCQLGAVMLVAVAVNDVFGFFGTWSSLLAPPQHARIVTVPAR